MQFAADAFWKSAGIVAPMLFGMMVIGVVVNLGQVGLQPASKKLKPDFGRLNLFKGIKRLFGMQAWWELGKALAKTRAARRGRVAGRSRTRSPRSRRRRTVRSGASRGDRREHRAHAVAQRRDRRSRVGGIDYIVQRRRLMKDLKMTRHEVREEMKQQEGNPAVKRAIRGRQMAISRNRMIGLVSSADVVIVNPTHYAVALKYDAKKGAPEVVAKGAGDIAKRIRDQAEANGVPDRARARPHPDPLQGLRARPAHPRRPLRGGRPAPGLRLRPPGQGPGRRLPRAAQSGPPVAIRHPKTLLTR